MVFPDPGFRLVGIDLQNDPHRASRIACGIGDDAQILIRARNGCGVHIEVVADIIRADMLAVFGNMLCIRRRTELIDGLRRIVLRNGCIVGIQVQICKLSGELLLGEMRKMGIEI